MKIKKVLKSFRLKLNKVGSNVRKKKLKTTDFSIISNNCYAGIVYQHLGLQYNTPTIGLYFYPNEYIKFLKNFDYYIKQKINFINTKDSKYFKELHELGYDNKIVGKLGDVEIVFLHYKTQKEANEKWNRRCARMSKNIIFKFNDQNFCTEQNLKDFDSLSLPNKICFVSQEHKELNSTIWIKKYSKLKEIKEDYYSGHKYFSIINYINSRFGVDNG